MKRLFGTKHPLDKTRLGFVDGLRAVCALYVLLHHIYITVWPIFSGFPGPTGLLSPATKWLFYGRFAVDIFILISGFSLMLPLVRGDMVVKGGYLQFYRRRIQRIVPPFYLAILASVTMIIFLLHKQTGTPWDLTLPLTASAIFANLLMIQDIWHRNTLNPAFWSIAVEFKIYFLFPLLVIGWQRIGAFSTTLVTALTSVTLSLLIIHTRGYDLTIHYIAIFCVGMYSAKLGYDGRRLSLTAVTGLVFVSLGCLIMLRIGVHGEQHPFINMGPIMDCLPAFTVAPFLVWCSRKPLGLPARILSIRPLVFIGTFSYSLYLIHMPLLQIMWQYVVHPIHTGRGLEFLLLLIGAPFICAMAYVFFILCERPFLKGRPKTERQLEIVVALEPAP